jgi:1-acyl-sn-glycerol-3-phosphate acyltransferase
MAHSRQILSRFFQIFWQTRIHAGILLRSRGADGRVPSDILHPVMTRWGKLMVETLGIDLARLGDRNLDEPALLVGNHVSYLDIPILMASLPVVFVAKKQIGSWPVFGTACRSVGTVFVERESGASRRSAGEAIGPYIVRERRSVAIFPSGTTTTDERKPWRWGAFLIAKRYGIPVRPFRLRYDPVRIAAFIDQDLFPVHLMRLLNSPRKLAASIEFHPPIQVTDPEAQCHRWWEWSREGLGPLPA